MAVDPLIELHDVNRYYGELNVLQGIDLTVGKGEVVVVIEGGRRQAVPPASGPVERAGEPARGGMTEVAVTRRTGPARRASDRVATGPRGERAPFLSEILKH
jgi:hypothetical protein